MSADTAPVLVSSSEVTDFLLRRRSHPVRTLRAPAPDRSALEPILRAGLRVPDHGKIEPWRLLVLSRPALARIAMLAEAYAREIGADNEKIAKARGQFDESPLAVVVISSPKDHPKVPVSEQILSAGAVCLGLVNAALAAGWGAVWLSGWVSHDTGFSRPNFGLAEGESIAGIIHIGTPGANPVPERPRPDPAALVQWIEA